MADVPPLEHAVTSPDVSLLSITFEELSVAEEELRAQNAELERAQSFLIAEHERYRELFQRAPVAYLVTDGNGVIRAANETAGKLLGCRSDRLIGKPLTVFTRDTSRRRLRGVLNALGGTEQTITTNLSMRDRNGRVRRVEATGAVARDLRGVLREIRWLLVDRTTQARRDRRRVARHAKLEALVAERTADLARVNDLKDQLLSTVNHEFRTALTAIGGYAELLELGIHGGLSKAQLDDVQRIQQAYTHLATVIDDLSNYGKLTAGKVKIDVTDLLLNDVLAGLFDLVRPQADRRGVQIKVMPVDPRTAVLADAKRLRQVLLNLVSNAIKFTPRGGVVSVRCSATESTVVIEVADTGEGIPADAHEAIFQPFVRLPSASGSSGTGLGLAISRELARAMGGDIELTESDKTGSRFAVRIARSTALAAGRATH